MPRRRRINLKYRKENSLLSDVLPYEVPLTFTNRHFYDFVVSNGIEYKDGEICWNSGDRTLDLIVPLLLGAKIPAASGELSGGDSGDAVKSFKIKGFLIPFSYKILHKEREHRELSIPHPRSQLQLAELYDSCKELILYYCSLSPFSIRQPRKVSKYIYHKDRVHYERLSDDGPGVEEYGKEYENLRSFFVYRDYSNVHKFFESYRHHRCEKKYNGLSILDVSKCFDSIYTHSLGWALLGKQRVKDVLARRNGRGAVDSTFAGRFDKFMQEVNYGETNGIIIGPEFSRIFAELVLQSVDRAVVERLEEHGLRHKSDYEIFRYVDDYFVFFDCSRTREKILEALQACLKEYKLYINFSKEKNYEKPIITEISMAKKRIAILLGEALVYELGEAGNGQEGKKDPQADGKPVRRGDIRIDSTSFITRFKTIVKECDVEYKSILNYSFAIIERRCERILKDYSRTSEDGRSERRKLVKAIIAVLEFTFFFYSVSPRVSTTVKLCRILRMFISFMKAPGVDKDLRDLVFKRIYDDTSFVLKKNRTSRYTQVETLYLLVVLSELGRDYWLEQDVLADYFNIYRDGENGNTLKARYELNYFSFTVMLFYMKEKKRYGELRHFAEKEIIARFRNGQGSLRKDAELIMLLFDTVSCPYVSVETKKCLLGIRK